MSSTNKTTNYNLSQYVGDDKPTYLGDYNGDMLKIDTQMKTNNNLATTATTAAQNAATNATNALNTANGANTKIGDLDNLVTTTKTNVVGAVNEVANKSVQNEGSIGNLANLNTETKTNLVGAINELAGLLDYETASQTTAVTSSSTSGEELEITSITLDPGIYYVSGICSGNANLANEAIQCLITFGNTATRLAGRMQARSVMILGGGVTNWSLIQVNSETTIVLKSVVKSTYGVLGSMCSIKIANLPNS